MKEELPELVREDLPELVRKEYDIYVNMFANDYHIKLVKVYIPPNYHIKVDKKNNL